jgi:CubicO group peptidase (beta-lactamase class C family)
MPSLSGTGFSGMHGAMAARVAAGELPGMVTLVARADHVHVDVIGTMAFGGDEPMGRDTIFRIASMTKPVVAAATMMLIEDGALSLDEPIDRLLPELANTGCSGMSTDRSTIRSRPPARSQSKTCSRPAWATGC